MWRPLVALRFHDWHGALWLLGAGGVLTLVMLPFSTYTSVLPLVQAEWGMDNIQAGFVFSAFLMGYAASALFLIPLTDRVPPRRVFLACVLASTLGHLLFPLLAHTFWVGALLRMIAGAALVGVYMPGIRIVAERYARKRRGMAVGVFVSASYLGGSLSFAITGLFLSLMPWRTSYLLVALLSGLGVLLALAIMRGSIGAATLERERSLRPPWLDLSVLRNQGFRLITVGYAMHTWELYLVRAWLPPLLASVLISQGYGLAHATAFAARLAALLFAAGVVGPFLGGLLSDRLGRTATASLVFAISGVCALSLGWLVNAPWSALLAIGALYGFASAADSSIYSTGVTELSSPDAVGSALGLQSFIGFSVAMLAPMAAGWALDLAPEAIGWGVAFGLAGGAALLGVGALLWLRLLPESARMAGGRR